MMTLNHILSEFYKPSWFIYSTPKKKEQKEKLIDNYNKTAHILNIHYNIAHVEHRGYCSLCGHELSVNSARCPFCRASIEEDMRYYHNSGS